MGAVVSAGSSAEAQARRHEHRSRSRSWPFSRRRGGCGLGLFWLAPVQRDEPARPVRLDGRALLVPARQSPSRSLLRAGGLAGCRLGASSPLAPLLRGGGEGISLRPIKQALYYSGHVPWPLRPSTYEG